MSTKKANRAGRLHLFRVLLRLCFQKLFAAKIWGLFLLTVVIAILSPVLAYISKLLADAIVKEGTSISLVMSLLLSIFFLTVVTDFIRMVNERLKAKLGEHLELSVESDILIKIDSVRRTCFDDPSTYDIISRVKNGLGNECASLLTYSFSLLSTVLGLITYSILLIPIHPTFPIILLMSGFLGFFFMVKHGYEEYFQVIRNSTAYRRSNYLQSLLTDRSYAKEIRTFHAEDYLIDKMETIHNVIKKEERQLLTKHSFLDFFGWLARNAGILCCVAITGFQIWNGHTTLGSLLLVFSAGEVFNGQVNGLFSYFTNISNMLLKIRDWDAFLKLPEEEFGQEPLENELEISFHDVHFTYPGAQQEAIAGISGKIHKGEVIAFVGENGSGKTTFINLLLGLYTCDKGEILINDKPLTDVCKTLRKKTACVMQNFNRYPATLKENIVLDRQDLMDDDYQNFPLCRSLAEAHDKGYDTMLGQFDDGATDLSGGEWQRVAIARALCRPNTSFIVMDEPAASLDPEIESKIYQEFRNLVRGKTAIITSHRLSACTIADRIYVFDHGRIIEEGSHEELMAKETAYKRIFEQQKRLYAYKKADSN